MLTAGSDWMRHINLPLEIIDNARGLSIENQKLLLMMAKAMRYTRECMARQDALNQSEKFPAPIGKTTKNKGRNVHEGKEGN